MKTSLRLSLALLAVVIVGGVLNIYTTKTISDRYVSAAEELRTLTEAEAQSPAVQVVFAGAAQDCCG